MLTKLQTSLTSRKYQMTNNVNDPDVFDPNKAFSQEDPTPRTIDFCINCETTNKIIGKITIGHKSGSICVKCFKAYQK